MNQQTSTIVFDVNESAGPFREAAVHLTIEVTGDTLGEAAALAAEEAAKVKDLAENGPTE